ncbi:cellulose synthase subunit BcsC-related outer membrane protein [Shigella flexneri]
MTTSSSIRTTNAYGWCVEHAWHYDKDLSGYSLGQGGYHSPRKTASFALPVNWRKRTENWSWELGAAGSWSDSKTKDVMRYPLRG